MAFLSTAVVDALADLGVDRWTITQTRLEPTPPKPCEACDTSTDVRVTTGVRWVCLDCAYTLTRRRELQEEIPA